jgi:hypothetical protein
MRRSSGGAAYSGRLNSSYGESHTACSTSRPMRDRFRAAVERDDHLDELHHGHGGEEVQANHADQRLSLLARQLAALHSTGQRLARARGPSGACSGSYIVTATPAARLCDPRTHEPSTHHGQSINRQDQFPSGRRGPAATGRCPNRSASVRNLGRERGRTGRGLSASQPRSSLPRGWPAQLGSRRTHRR